MPLIHNVLDTSLPTILNNPTVMHLIGGSRVTDWVRLPSSTNPHPPIPPPPMWLCHIYDYDCGPSFCHIQCILFLL